MIANSAHTKKKKALSGKRKPKDDKVWNEKTPANRVVSDEEWKVLWLIFHKGKPLAKETPTLTWLLHIIAKVGGWCNSQRTGVPGWQVSYLHNAEDCFGIFKQ